MNFSRVKFRTQTQDRAQCHCAGNKQDKKISSPPQFSEHREFCADPQEVIFLPETVKLGKGLYFDTLHGPQPPRSLSALHHIPLRLLPSF